ncbi:MAG: hypothetical protein Q7R52_03180 [archaeon]|nr:hypothetical protein [archaeon]
MSYSYKNKRAGWDDLYEEYFEDIEKIIEDNLNLKHNGKLVEKTFLNMTKVLDKAIIRMENAEGNKETKKPWFEKVKNLKEFADAADTVNKKVISITIIDQFLRATY